MSDLTIQDLTMTDQMTGTDNARPVNDGPLEAFGQITPLYSSDVPVTVGSVVVVVVVVVLDVVVVVLAAVNIILWPGWPHPL